MYHINILWLALRQWLEVSKGEETPAVTATVDALALAWCGRHGVALQWPESLMDYCLASCDERDPTGATVAAMRPALERLLAAKPVGPATEDEPSEQWHRAVQCQIRARYASAAAARSAVESVKT